MTESTVLFSVVQIIPSVSEVHGGPTQVLQLMERALASQGIAAETVTTDDDGVGRRLCGETLDSPVVRRYFRKDTEFYKVSFRLAKWLLRGVNRFDVVHIHALFSFSSVAAAWAARRAGVPYVITPHGSLSPYGMTRRRRLMKSLSLRFVEGPLLREAAAVHFTSEVEREHAAALGIPMRGVVIPLGYEASPAGSRRRFLEALPGVHLFSHAILFLSRLDPVKNIEALIASLALLKAEGLRPALIVAGAGPSEYVEELQQLAAAKGIADQVFWLGHVSGDLKADALAAADVFVLPSFSENFGMAVVEAMSARLPVVLSEGVALAAAVQAAGAGIAVSPSAEQLADGLGRLLRDEELLKRAADAAVAMVQRDFSLSVMGRRLFDLYESLVHRASDSGPQGEKLRT